MQFSAPFRKLATAAVIGLFAGGGAPLAAPSPASGQHDAAIADRAGEDALLEDYAADDDYVPGMHGVDYALITGPRAPASEAVPACADDARRGDLRDCQK